MAAVGRVPSANVSRQPGDEGAEVAERTPEGAGSFVTSLGIQIPRRDLGGTMKA